jgi:hypothetical protein
MCEAFPVDGKRGPLPAGFMRNLRGAVHEASGDARDHWPVSGLATRSSRLPAHSRSGVDTCAAHAIFDDEI